jgi:hypothetical protein
MINLSVFSTLPSLPKTCSNRRYMYVCVAFTCLQTVWVIIKYACSSNQVNIYACVSYKGERLQLYGSFLFIFFNIN